MTGDEHLAWCRQRALELLDAGEPQQAVTSMMSDLMKHDETIKFASFDASRIAMKTAASGDVAAVREWIEGFV